MKLLDTESLRNYLSKRAGRLPKDGLAAKVKRRRPQVKVFDRDGHLLAVERSTDRAKALIEVAEKLVKQSRSS